MPEQFQVKSDLELWAELDMDVERFKNVPSVLTQVYKDIFLSQDNRPESMAYFDEMISNIYAGRIQEIVDAKKAGRPVIGTFCVYVPEASVLAFAEDRRRQFRMLKRPCPAISARWSSRLSVSKSAGCAPFFRPSISFTAKQPAMPRKKPGNCWKNMCRPTSWKYHR